MTEQVDLEILAELGAQRLEMAREQAQAAAGRDGRRRVLLHLRPDRLGQDLLGDRLERPVLGLEDRLLDVVEHAAGAQRLEVDAEPPGLILENCAQGLAEAGAPGDEQGIDPVRLEIRRHDPDPLDRFVFVVEAAMGVDHELLPVLRGQPGARPDRAPRRRRWRRRSRPRSAAAAACRRCRARGCAHRPHRSTRARPRACGRCRTAGRRPSRTRRARRRRLLLQRRAIERDRRAAGDHRRAHHGDPGVHAVLDPVGIGQDRKAAVAPARPPRVLDDEAVGVVADDREGVAAGFLGVRSCRSPAARRTSCTHQPSCTDAEA